MTGTYLALAVVLLILNGFFVGAEFALIAARRSKIEQLAAGGSKRANVALRSVKELSLMLAGAQLGITMASLGLGAVAEPAIAHLIESGIESFVHLSDTALHTISFVIALTIVIFFHMVIGEMAPKNIAIAEPEKTALFLAIPFRAYTTAFKPFIYLLNVIANAGVRLFGVEPKDELENIHSSSEIGLLIAESAKGGYLDRFEHRLLSGAIAFSERDAASVMVPRTDLIGIPHTATPDELEQLILESGHSRFPAYVKNLDTIIGFFHARDLLNMPEQEKDKPIPRRFMRKMLVVPESLKLHPLLLQMRGNRQHFALVLDEHGGTAGIVTIEDLLEELVGEIRDEYDDTELGIERVTDNRFMLPGTLHIGEASARIGLDLPEGDYETVAGFLMDRLGRIPKRRDTVTEGRWTLRVLTMHRRRVVQVMAEKAPREPTDGD